MFLVKDSTWRPACRSLTFAPVDSISIPFDPDVYTIDVSYTYALMIWQEACTRTLDITGLPVASRPYESSAR